MGKKIMVYLSESLEPKETTKSHLVYPELLHTISNAELTFSVILMVTEIPSKDSALSEKSKSSLHQFSPMNYSFLMTIRNGGSAIFIC